MSRLRIHMQAIRTILRYYHAEQYSQREIARLLNLSSGTVRNYLRRAESAGLSWPLPAELTDQALEARLFPTQTPSSKRPQPDWQEVHKQLARKGMTLERVYATWIDETPGGYSYGYFCSLYKAWCQQQTVTMRLEHKAGDKLYVDFAGKTMEVYHPVTGEVTKAQIFVATLGCSNYTYVEALPDQSLHSWIAAHVRCLNFLGAVPKVIVCDNLKAAVIRHRRKNIQLNPTYSDFSRHYEIILSPARVRHPQDKAAVETAVKFCSTRILTRLDSQQFFSIEELNQEIRPLLEDLNRQPFQKKSGSRRSQFEELDLPAMRPLPAHPYLFREWKKLKVANNYHVYANKCSYSVPHRYVRQTLDVAISSERVECFAHMKRIAEHTRCETEGGYSTKPEHMPKKHRQFMDRERLLRRARAVGLHTAELITHVLERKSCQEQNFNSVQEILRLKEKYSDERLEAACQYALTRGERAYNCPSIASILKQNQDQRYQAELRTPSLWHNNIRGGDYYS